MPISPAILAMFSPGPLELLILGIFALASLAGIALLITLAAQYTIQQRSNHD